MAGDWMPHGAEPQFLRPEVGSLIATPGEVWRVIDYVPYPEDMWTDEDRENVAKGGEPWVPYRAILRPAQITSTDVRARDHDKHFTVRGPLRWHVYKDEHYPVCASCGEPTPCREQTAAKAAEHAAKDMARYEVAGVCPACQEPVTERQATRTYEENLYVPCGPPVTFHAGRRGCWNGLVRYEDKWVAADPESRKHRYRCEGVLTTHSEAEYECTQGVDCPGPQAGHRGLSGCDCPWHENRCHKLAKDARNIALDGLPEVRRGEAAL